MLKKLKKKTNLIFLFFVILFSLPSIFGLIHSGFPQTDDGNWMVIRFSAFYEVIRSGEFPVRFLSRLNNGFGYPVSNFLYPLFMYLGTPIHILGASFTETIKILFSLSLVFSSVFTFLWLRKVFDNLSIFVVSILYVFFPYHLFDVYTRGSLGEMLALSILPFIFWQIERRSIFFSTIGIYWLILSHNTLALFFIPLLFGYAFLRNKRQLKLLLICTILGVGISSFFSIPAVYDLQYTVFSNTKVSDLNLYFIDFVTIKLLGLGFILFLFHSIFNILKHKNTKFIFALIFVLLITLFTLSFSKDLWLSLPLTNLIQFPFRLISILIPISAFMVSYLLSKEKHKRKYILVVLYIVLILFSAKNNLFSEKYQYYDESFYSTNMDTTTVKKEYMPKWIKDNNMEYKASRIENLEGEERVNIRKVTPKEIIFDTYLTNKRIFRANKAYFPGWVVYVNGEKSEIYYEKTGLIEFSLEKGQNNVKVTFEETNIRILSDVLSIIGVIALFSIVILQRLKKIKI
jgi:hypothetical protein